MKNVKPKIVYLLVLMVYQYSYSQSQQLPPPNIVWISWEDVGPHLGAYGDEYANTPNMDRLADEGFTYLNAYSNYPVCAPARATIITGQYANSFGGQFMRVRAIPGQDVKLFPEFLRKAGYYCTNDVKTDYQMEFDPDVVWDEIASGARWDGRAPGQPFFSVINFGTTHEGRSRTENVSWVREIEKALKGKRHDPKQAPVPPYFPDNEIVRENIALYYANMTYTDSISNLVLERLEKEGLAENTIVMFWGDHGWGLPRGKRWPYQSGLRVPLIIKVPQKYREAMLGSRNYQPGDKIGELVSFVDFAPTILSLAGIEIPDYMQGKAFLGSQAKEPRKYVYGGRGRMDETYDCMRTVIDDNYLYMRNYMWHLPYAQTVRSMERQAILQEWRRLHKEGKLNKAQNTFFQYPKPVEELYDLKNDPHQIYNLAGEKRYQKTLERFREENKNHMLSIHDVGLITEQELDMMRWEDGKCPKTTTPQADNNYRNYWNGDVEVSLSCSTPGASLVWKYKDSDNWQLYTQKIVLGPNDILQAKAHRLGFYTSDIAEFQPGFETVKIKDEINYVPWQEKVRENNLIERLVELKELDLEGSAALDKYYDYLNDEAGSIRYWSTVGIRLLNKNEREKEKADRRRGELRK